MEEVNKAQNEYNTAATTANQYQTASSMLPAALSSAINEKIDYNKGLIEEKNKSMVDYFNAPSQARVDYQDIWNPFQREALVQKATNLAYLPYQNNVDNLTARMGSISDIIAKATGAFGAQVTSANNAATIADKKIDLAKWKYDQIDKGGAGGTDSFLPTGYKYDAFGNIVPIDNVPTKLPPTETQPTNPPPNNPGVKWRSPEGQWEWSGSYQSWVPAGETNIE